MENIEAKSSNEDGDRESYINNINKKIKIIDFMKMLTWKKPHHLLPRIMFKRNHKRM